MLFPHEKDGYIHIEQPIEIITNGKLCPRIVISTDEKTDYVSLIFLPIDGQLTHTMMTKSAFKKFTTLMNDFYESSNQVYTPKKQILTEQNNLDD